MEQLTDYSIIKEQPYLMEPIGVLDKGYVRLIDWNGSDKRIVDAARVSYQQGTKRVRDDTQLIDYLMRHGHWSPFELPNVTFELKMPLYLVAQWKRYRTAKLNEQSARYSEMPNEFHVPETLRIQDKDNKQASSGRMQKDSEVRNIQAMEMVYDDAYQEYLRLLDEGVPREQARAVLPTGLYTTLVWQQDLRNLFNLLKQRIHDNAQDEVTAYAQVIGLIVSKLFPKAYEAFEEHQMYSVTLSRTDMRLLQELHHQLPEAEEFIKAGAEAKGYRKSRIRELTKKLFTVVPSPEELQNAG